MSENRRKHTFDEYHALRVSKREALLRRALDLLKTARFDTMTALAKNAAQLITELEKRQAKDGENPPKMSYTTLVRRGSKYKHILLAHFEGASEGVQSDEEAELEELRLHCAHLEHENDLLKNRLSTVSHPKRVETVLEDEPGVSMYEDIEMLIDLIDVMVHQVPDVFTVVGPNGVDVHQPDPGMYGPDGLVAEYETLQRMNELREELKNENK